MTYRKIRKGFTLIELLVVISVISMLTSVVLVSVNPVQAKARDAKRAQQIRQIDLATRFYTETNGHAPYLTGCEALQTTDSNLINDNSSGQVSACFAVSTSSVDPQKAQWTEFVDQIKAFMPSVPSDPCPSCTPGSSSYPLGYTYVAPRAMQYICSQSGLCTQSPNQLNQQYQLYAGLEKQSTPSGSSPTGSFTPPIVVNPPGPIPTVSMSRTYQADNTYLINWSVSNANSCSVTEGYFSMVDQDGDSNTAPDFVSIPPVASISPTSPVPDRKNFRWVI
jgi:prepilin-type N-terminal cleavage/methylation domain-containing protein